MENTTCVSYFKRAVLLLLPPKCYDEYFVNFNFLDVPCLKAAVSKTLGLAIVSGSFMVKFPQIVKIWHNQSAVGLSFLSVLMDLYAVTAGVAYNFAKGFPFSAWGDAFFMLIQTATVAALVLHFNYSTNAGAAFIAIYASIIYVLNCGLTPVNVLWSLQAVSVPIMFGGKMLQAYTNYNNGSTGQLSAVMCIMLLFGSTARIFTSIQETGDAVIIITYTLATIGNAILVSQFLCYHKSAKPSALKLQEASKKKQ